MAEKAVMEQGFGIMLATQQMHGMFVPFTVNFSINVTGKTPHIPGSLLDVKQSNDTTEISSIVLITKYT